MPYRDNPNFYTHEKLQALKNRINANEIKERAMTESETQLLENITNEKLLQNQTTKL
jgi:hypothetical protein